MAESQDSGKQRSGQPSLVPGVVMLALAAVLIVVMMINPEMPGWLRTTIVVAAIALILGLLGYAFFVFSRSVKQGRK